MIESRFKRGYRTWEAGSGIQLKRGSSADPRPGDVLLALQQHPGKYPYSIYGQSILNGAVR